MGLSHALCRRIAAIAAALLVFVGPFCAAQAPATSGAATPTVAPDAAQPAAAAAPPAPSAAGPAGAPTSAAKDAAPVDTGVDIVLVLPLAAPDYARAAEAVRDGFLAAAGAAKASDRCRVIGHGDGDVLAAFAAAKSLGARVVVGPLVRDDLRTLVAAAEPLPLTLALNQLDDGATLPPQLYTLALSVESDARTLARRMRDGGASTIALIGNASPISRRFASAFAAEWLLAGGGPIETVAYDARPDALTELRRTLAKSPADAALLALDGQDAATARNFALRIPVYAISLINQPHAPSVLNDLEGVRFVDLPWLVTPGERALAGLPRKDTGNVLLDRLYALGLDAFAVARAFREGVPERLDIAGATGQLALAEGRQVTRDGVLAVFRQGQVVPADAPR
jgi:outer membrane PBP1 activator LpoA protein